MVMELWGYHFSISECALSYRQSGESKAEIRKEKAMWDEMT